MNFSEFKEDLAIEFSLTQDQSKRILSFLTHKIRERILFGEEISLREIGAFRLRVRKPKKFLHLKTGEIAQSKKCYYLDFKPTKKMVDELKKKTVY